MRDVRSALVDCSACVAKSRILALPMGGIEVKSITNAQRTQVVDEWINVALELFPLKSRSFFKTKADPFDNPIGHALATELPKIFDALADGVELAETADSLDCLTEVLCIQGIPPSEALAFIPRLKQVLDAANIAPPSSSSALCSDRIDRLLLLAFDSYSRQQARIADIRVGEIKRRVSTLININRRAWEEPDSLNLAFSEERCKG